MLRILVAGEQALNRPGCAHRWKQDFRPGAGGDMVRPADLEGLALRIGALSRRVRMAAMRRPEAENLVPDAGGGGVGQGGMLSVRIGRNAHE